MLHLYREFWYFLTKYLALILPGPIFLNFIRFVNYNRLGFKYYPLNLKEPKTFNEKLNYVKLNFRPDLGSKAADKVEVREYVSEVIGSEYLVPLIGIYENARDIDFDKLPNQFVIKANHGSGWNLICTNKDDLNWSKELSKLNKWLSRNAFYVSIEWQYKNIKPRLICEKLLGYDIKDYKIFCNNGNALFVQVDSDRFTNHTRSIYDSEWNELDICIRYDKITPKANPPHNLKEMLSLASKLSEPFKICRVDFYEVESKIYFGEITLFPGGGQEPFHNYEQDLKFGSYFSI